MVFVVVESHGSFADMRGEGVLGIGECWELDHKAFHGLIRRVVDGLRISVPQRPGGRFRTA